MSIKTHGASDEPQPVPGSKAEPVSDVTDVEKLPEVTQKKKTRARNRIKRSTLAAGPSMSQERQRLGSSVWEGDAKL